MCRKRGGCAGFQQPKIIPPPLAETAEKIREVTYRFSWVSFVATLPRLALLSLHTTDPVTTAAGWCLAPAGATREPPQATQLPEEGWERSGYITHSSGVPPAPLLPEVTAYRRRGPWEQRDTACLSPAASHLCSTTAPERGDTQLAPRLLLEPQQMFAAT